MKVTIDVDLTPEEARTLLGLPDLKPMQARFLEQMEKQMAQNMSYMDPETFMKVMVPASAQGLERFQSLLFGMANKAMGEGGRRAPEPKDGPAGEDDGKSDEA